MNLKFIKKGVIVTSLVVAIVAPGENIIASKNASTVVMAKEKKVEIDINSLINTAAGFQEQERNRKEVTVLSNKEIKFNKKLLNKIFVATENGSAIVYSEPKEESDWIGKVFQDTAVTVVKKDKEWTLLESGNVKGYVKTEQLLVGSAATEHAKNILTTVYAGQEIFSLNKEEIEAAFSCGETKEEEIVRIAKEQEEQRIAAEAARQEKRAAVVAYAKQFIGNPYVYGGTSLTRGTDCSGFVRGVYRHFGVSLPRTSSAMRSVGYKVSARDMQPGDIVCYSGHVGIYAGNGKIVNAINEQKGIGMTSVYYKPIITVRRIF